jgi:hypothetical protein
MTDEQINAAIAEACGWRQSETNIAHWHHVSEPYSHILFRDLPNYCTDLNSMHEAEKVLTVPQEKDYFANLEEIVGDLIWFRSAPKSHRATAKDRAEAFLRTLGKWEEVQK